MKSNCRLHTCSRLLSADGDIREAAVSSALDQLGDLGGSRLSAALRVSHWADALTLLVIDSSAKPTGSTSGSARPTRSYGGSFSPVGQAHGTSSLTSRSGNKSHQVGEFQPLRYPDDVEPSSTAGSTTGLNGATNLPPRLRGALASSRPLPCR